MGPWKLAQITFSRSKPKNKPLFARFSYSLSKYWFERKMFQTKLLVCKNGVFSHPVIGWRWITEYCSSGKCWPFYYMRRGDRGAAVTGFYKSCSLILRVIRFRHRLMRVLFWLLSEFGLWFVVFAERAESTPKLLCSFFWIWFVVFSEQAKPTRNLLGLFICLCSWFVVLWLLFEQTNVSCMKKSIGEYWIQ